MKKNDEQKLMKFSKVLSRIAANNISQSAVPIGRRMYACAIHPNASNIIYVRCNHLPVICSSATTIHTSQGSACTELIYECNQTHTYNHHSTLLCSR